MSDFAQRMQALKARFIDEARSDAVQIEASAAAHAWDRVGAVCHRLAGRAGMFGFADLSDAASALEEAIEAMCPADEIESQTSQLVARLRSL